MNPDVDPNQPEAVEIDVDQIERAREEMSRALARTAHNWLQSGTMVSCSSCPFGHGFGVPPGTQLIGIDDTGKPILKKAW